MTTEATIDIDPEKLIAAIYVRIQSSLEIANERPIYSNDLTVWQAHGYKSAADYCESEDPVYLVCQQLLRAAKI